MDVRGGTGDGELAVDVDSTICEVHGYAKQGAGYGYTRQRGHRADIGEILHTRMHTGSANSRRGAQRFVRETIGRVRRARPGHAARRLGVLVEQGDPRAHRP